MSAAAFDLTGKAALVTGGTSGIGYLAKVLSHTFFPELWTVRTRV